MAIYDVTDKASPRVISTTGYPTATYTHQGALTPDQRYFLFGDELDEQGNGQNTTTYVLDGLDLDDPPTPAAHLQATRSIDHNQYVHGNRTYQPGQRAVRAAAAAGRRAKAQVVRNPKEDHANRTLGRCGGGGRADLRRCRPGGGP